MKLCACGCGAKVPPSKRGKRRFLTGHWWRGRTRAEKRLIGQKGVATRTARGYAMRGAVGHERIEG